MLELHVGEFLGDVDRGVHVAKGGGEDQVGTVERHLRHHTLGIGAFGNAFDENGLDLVAELFFDGQAALVVLIGPAAVAHGADKDKADLGLVLGNSARSKAERKGRAGHKG